MFEAKFLKNVTVDLGKGSLGCFQETDFLNSVTKNKYLSSLVTKGITMGNTE